MNEKLLPGILSQWQRLKQIGHRAEIESAYTLLRVINGLRISWFWDPYRPSEKMAFKRFIQEKIEEEFLHAYVEGLLDWEYLPELIQVPKALEDSVLRWLWSDPDLSAKYIKALEDRESELKSKLCLINHIKELVDREVSKRQGRLALWFAHGKANTLRQKFRKALNYYDKILEKDPLNASVWAKKGETLLELASSSIYHTKEKWEIWDKILLEGWEGIITRDAQDEESQTEKENFVKEAIECLDKALNLVLPEKEKAYAYLVKARALVKINKPVEAIKHLDKALQLNSSLEEVIRAKIEIKIELEEFDDVIKCYELLCKNDYASWEDYIAKGIFLAIINKYVESIETFEKILDLAYDKKDEILYNEARVHCVYENFKAAKECLTKIENMRFYKQRIKEDEVFKDLLSDKEFTKFIGLD